MPISEVCLSPLPAPALRLLTAAFQPYSMRSFGCGPVLLPSESM